MALVARRREAHMLRQEESSSRQEALLVRGQPCYYDSLS